VPVSFVVPSAGTPEADIGVRLRHLQSAHRDTKRCASWPRATATRCHKQAPAPRIIRSWPIAIR